jgi:hypothetical protein
VRQEGLAGIGESQGDATDGQEPAEESELQRVLEALLRQSESAAAISSKAQS